jgi:hypothetical protein
MARQWAFLECLGFARGSIIHEEGGLERSVPSVM